MAHIEIDTEDLSLLSNDINEMNVKIDNLKSTINTKFENIKDNNFYLEGFKKINTYLEKQVEKMNTFKFNLSNYQNDINNLENVFSEKFNSITIPNLQSNGSSLVVVMPTVNVTPTVQNNYEGVNTTTNSSNELNDETKKEEKIESKKEEKPIEKKDEVIVQKPVEKNEKKEDNNTGFNVFGALAGTVGVLGGGALAAAGIKKYKENNEDEEEEKSETLEEV